MKQSTLLHAHAQQSVWCPAAQPGTWLAKGMRRRAVREPVRGRTRRTGRRRTGWRGAGRRRRRTCVRRRWARRSYTGTGRVRHHSALDRLGKCNCNHKACRQHSRVDHGLHPFNASLQLLSSKYPCPTETACLHSTMPRNLGQTAWGARGGGLASGGGGLGGAVEQHTIGQHQHPQLSRTLAKKHAACKTACNTGLWPRVGTHEARAGPWALAAAARAGPWALAVAARVGPWALAAAARHWSRGSRCRRLLRTHQRG